MTITIRATGMELTPAIRQYVEEKFAMLEKYVANILLADVEVGMSSHHHQKGDIFSCSVTLEVPGDVLRVQKEEEDLYKAIDKVKDHLKEVLIDRKEKNRDAHRKNTEEPTV